MEKSEYLFLSHVIDQNTPTYGKRDSFVEQLNSSFKNGANAETTSWSFSNNHLGTHIDAPRHFIPEGRAVTDFGADSWIFRKIAYIEIPCTEAVLIGVKEISQLDFDRNSELLLIKTGYEQYRTTEKYWMENPGLTPEVGAFLKQTCPELRMIGFDFISVSSFQHRKAGRDAHLALLGGERPLLPIEDMSLMAITLFTRVEEVIVLPLRVKASNGAPVTILAKVTTQQIKP